MYDTSYQQQQQKLNKKQKFHLVTVGFEPTTRDSIVSEAAALPSELAGKLSFNFAV